MRFLPLKWYHRKSFKYTMTSRKREVVIYRKATERHHEMKTNNNPIDENTKDRQESGSALSSRQRVILDALLREYEVALMLDLPVRTSQRPVLGYDAGYRGQLHLFLRL